MSELNEINRKLGEMCGTLKAVQKSQDETKTDVRNILEKHDKRIASLEGTRKTMFGAAIGSGLFGGISITSLFKFFQ